MNQTIFVFGSNLAGRHGRGSALEAVQNWGAKYGQGFGRQGQSYAIPTKDEHLAVLPLSDIQLYVNLFLAYANRHPELAFRVVKVGCGLAGYKETEIMPFFADVPVNVDLPRGW